jgi:hypothetical protein
MKERSKGFPVEWEEVLSEQLLTGGYAPSSSNYTLA